MASNYIDELVAVYLWLIILRDRDIVEQVAILKYFQDHPDEMYSKL